MRYFPIFIDLKDRAVVIVGGGEEALRKARLLGKTEARLKVIAESLHDELAAMPSVTWLARRFDASLLDGATLVCTAEPDLNEAVAAAAKARGIPVNVVDHPELSTFIVPSIVDRDPVVVAIGTEGTAPILGQGLRARFDAMLPQALGALAKAGAQLRDKVGNSIPAGNRRRSFWQRFFFGDTRDTFLAGETSAFEVGVARLMAQEALPPRGRVSFVSAGSGEAELLTLKAQRKLQEADVILHDRFISAAILETARRDAVRISTGTLGFIEIAARLAGEALAGKHVVRLASGETSVEELAAVAADGIPVETVPGVGSLFSGDIISFPVREDIRDAILKAAS